MSITAWYGIVKMHSASWGDEAGSTVTFKLSMQASADVRNPFHTFTKRRKGRAGTRFYMAVTTSEDAPKSIYLDEVMLAGWNDSQQNGHTVKLWICNDKLGHPFEGISRNDELALALTELDDDNEPIDQKMRDRVEQQSTPTSSRLSYAAAMLCKNDSFWEYLNEDMDQANDFMNPRVKDESGAKKWMYQELGISSRAELDTDPVAARRFEDVIRKPFMEYIGSMC